MTVLKTYLKRMAARPWMISLTIAVPVLMVLIVSAGGGGNGMRVALIDRDESLLSRTVREAVEPVARFVDLEYDEIGAALVDGRIEYALVLPAGMQNAVVAGERARVEAYSLHGVQMTRMVQSAANTVLSAAHNIALHTEGDATRFERALERVRDGRFGLEIETFRGEQGALAAVCFALAVANTMKTVRRTAITANLLIMPFVMLGGAFWPFDIMPEYLQRIGAFSPTRWTTSAVGMALSGAPFADIAPQLGVLALFALVFGLLGSWRRVDVAK